ncbi:YceI family protein [Nocardioides sp. CPCC 205120]|uniref:YceI family protein n=1 Tax=Nocardioides sp. CPCC 205120 TaxID=3406462 RepID=UPI003B50C791
MGIFSRTKDSAPAEQTFDAPTTAVDDITGSYALDVTHTRLGFSVRHAMVTTVRGSFKEFDGTATINTTDPAASTVALTIKAASIDTGNADRDGHLQTGDFFEAEKYPNITFVSTKVEREDADTWLVTGDLTIKDVTKSVTVELEQTGSARDPFGNLRIGFEGGVAINRKDWGLTYNAALETGGVLISEKVKLEFDVSAIQSA